MVDPENMGTEVTVAIRGPCNYSCSYCVAKNSQERTSEYSLPRLEGIYSQLGDFVVTTMECGGSEPTIHPQIRAILEMALEHGPVSIPTNNSVPPERWLPRNKPQNMLVRAALHPQGEKRLDAFLRHLLQLREIGADIRVILVGHPDRLDAVERYRDYFGKRNIPVQVVAFQGGWNGRPYPQSYTSEEIRGLGLGVDAPLFSRLSVETTIRDFSAIPCLAGYRSIYIGTDGELYRCLYDKVALNMPLKKAAPCRVNNCGCGLYLEELSVLGDPVYCNYWRGVAGLPPLVSNDPRSPDEKFQHYRATYWDLMKRYDKIPPDFRYTRLIFKGDTTILHQTLNRTIYGSASGRELARSGFSLRFAPTTARDHLSTDFMPVVFDGQYAGGWALLELEFSNIAGETSNINVLVQDQSYTTLVELRSAPGEPHVSSKFKMAPGRTKSIRLVFLCDEGQPSLMPDKVSLSQGA